jgi:outer membrane protein
MKSSVALLLLSFSLIAHPAVDLKESFEAARKNMESIKRAKSVVEQSLALKDEARATILPTISGVGTYTKIDPPNAAGASPFLLTKQYSAAIRLNQPLFRGGLVSAYEFAKENVLLAKYQQDATAINLYQLVINAYYNLAIAQLDVKNVKDLLKYSRERVDEIRGRTKIGRSRQGELVEAQAQLHIADSQYQQTLLNLQQSEKTFEFYTNIESGKLVVPTELPKLEGPVGEYIMKVRNRPDIKAIRQQVNLAEQQINIAKGSHYPQVDLTSNYYLDRTGVLETSEWDVGVAVVVPLFQGGAVSAQVKQATESKRIAELTSRESIRAAERDITINYQNFLQIKLQLNSLKEALSKAEEVYKLNKKDYQYGLVTNLDVLQSLNVFIETKRTYDNLISLGHLNYKNLQALTGALP